MQGHIIALIICVPLLVLGLIAILRSGPNSQPPKRGTAPGDGVTEKRIHMRAASSAGVSHSFTMRHTKDPKKHAQAMMPAKVRKSKK